MTYVLSALPVRKDTPFLSTAKCLKLIKVTRLLKLVVTFVRMIVMIRLKRLKVSSIVVYVNLTSVENVDLPYMTHLQPLSV